MHFFLFKGIDVLLNLWLLTTTKSIKGALIQLLCDPSVILPESLNTTSPVASLWLIYLDNNFEVKPGGNA